MFDFAVSYASEQIEYVRDFVKTLKSLGATVFFDRDEYERLIDSFLHEELQSIFEKESQHCILFLSYEYIKKPHTMWESRIALSESLYRPNYISIVKFDDIRLPGQCKDLMCINSSDHTPQELAEILFRKYKSPKESTITDEKSNIFPLKLTK